MEGEKKKRGPLRRALAGIGIMVFVGMAVASVIMRYQDAAYRSAAVTIDGRVRVRAMVADTPEKRRDGLAVREALAADEGMLFVFETPDNYGFWMRNMQFPIDIIWLKDGKIADLMTDLPPPGGENEPLPVYRPAVAVREVLEVPAGFAARHGLRLGMTVDYLIDSK
jgi:uncharacterized membrane protein (UPF0127 family)